MMWQVSQSISYVCIIMFMAKTKIKEANDKIFSREIKMMELFFKKKARFFKWSIWWGENMKMEF